MRDNKRISDSRARRLSLALFNREHRELEQQNQKRVAEHKQRKSIPRSLLGTDGQKDRR